MGWNEERAWREFVARVRLRMDDVDLNHGELAERIGTSRPSVTKMLGSTEPAWPFGDRMVRMPDALECNGHWLMTGKGPMQRPDLAPPDLRYTVAQEFLADLESWLTERRWLTPLPQKPGK